MLHFVTRCRSLSSKGCRSTYIHIHECILSHVFVISWKFIMHIKNVKRCFVGTIITITFHLFHTVTVWSPETALFAYNYEDDFWTVVSILATSNHSLNFYLYILSGTQFRNQFLIMIRCIPKKMSAAVTKPRRNISTIST